MQQEQCLPSHPLPLQCWLAPSKQGQPSGTCCNSLSATKPGSKPVAVLTYLTVPGSKWSCEKSRSVVAVSVAETSKSGAQWQRPLRVGQDGQAGAPLMLTVSIPQSLPSHSQISDRLVVTDFIGFLPSHISVSFHFSYFATV